MKTIVGLFADPLDAERTVTTLSEQGFEQSDISVAARDTAIQAQVAGSSEPDLAESAVAGAIGGSAIGGLAGLLVGVGALAIPGIGPVIAIGPLAAAVGSATATIGATAAGAGIGAAAGTLIGALVALGIPEEDASFYAEGIRRGGVLVTVRTDDTRAGEALSIMRQHRAMDIETQRDEWRDNDWSGFDAGARHPPLTNR